MGTEYVNSIADMKSADSRFNARIRVAVTEMLVRMANVNVASSQEIAKEVNFQGTLVSSIKLNPINSTVVRVISSTPGEYGSLIEYGIPPEGNPLQLKNKTLSGNWITFDEQPLLETWVRQKLMSKSPEKANVFLKLKAVPVGHNGYPYGYPKGLRFMETGFYNAVAQSDNIVSSELMKLNV